MTFLGLGLKLKLVMERHVLKEMFGSGLGSWGLMELSFAFVFVVFAFLKEGIGSTKPCHMLQHNFSGVLKGTENGDWDWGGT